MNRACPHACAPQAGAVLLTVLLTLTVLMLLAGSAAQTVWLGEKMTRNAFGRVAAFEAAEAALLDAEDDILRSRRAALFTSNNVTAFPAQPGCQTNGDRLGLCRAVTGSSIWQDLDLASSASATVPYGSFTGNRYVAARGAPAPRYVIEVLPDAVPVAGERADALSFQYQYRITAIGFNPDATAPVVLEKILRKE